MNDMAASPRQIRFLKARGFQGVETWSFEEAKAMVDRITANGWRVPQGIIPEEYSPGGTAAAGVSDSKRQREIQELIDALDRLDDEKLHLVWMVVQKMATIADERRQNSAKVSGQDLPPLGT